MILYVPRCIREMHTSYYAWWWFRGSLIVSWGQFRDEDGMFAFSANVFWLECSMVQSFGCPFTLSSSQDVFTCVVFDRFCTCRLCTASVYVSLNFRTFTRYCRSLRFSFVQVWQCASLASMLRGILCYETQAKHLVTHRIWFLRFRLFLVWERQCA